MRILDVCLGIAWLCFWVGWIAVGAVTAPRGYTRTTNGIVIRLAIVVIVIVLLRTRVISGTTDSAFDAATIAGLALFLAGLAIAIWARVTLGRNWGMPMSEIADARLITAGPYRRIRHPIYTGLILAMVGTALVLGVTWLVVAALLGAYFVYSAVVEDGINERRFPTAYPAYRATTKLLVPFVL